METVWNLFVLMLLLGGLLIGLPILASSLAG